MSGWHTYFFHSRSHCWPSKGKYYEMPTGSYLSLVQGVVVLSHTSHKKEADEFLQYVKTKPMSEIFRKYGFSLPEEAR